jgi:Holliday junction resolvase
MRESKLQAEVVQWLKAQGVYVIKTRPGPGTPVGCPDIIGLYHDLWLAIEVKRSADAPFQPGQQHTLKILRQTNPWVYVVYPENWGVVKEELFTLIGLS